jgi:multiple sugar transport system permease protein
MATAASQKRAGTRPRISKQLRDDLRAYLFVSPWIVSLLAFTAYPVLASFYFAMTRYNVVQPPEWVGLENFGHMFFSDPLFWIAVWNTTYYALISVPLSLLVALLLAMLLNQIASTMLWLVLLNPQNGLINAALEAVGLPRLAWLKSADWAKPGIILMSLWTGVGGAMLIFLAGLKDTPQSLLEAAEIDGANAFQRLRHVTIPLLTPTIFFNLIMGIIASFQVFGQVLVVTTGAGAGGPRNSLLMYMLLLYRSAFRNFEMGYASAMALVLFMVLVVLTLLVVRSSNYWVHYEGSAQR